MSAQTSHLAGGLFGAVPALMLVLVLVLAMLGVVAHVAFA